MFETEESGTRRYIFPASANMRSAWPILIDIQVTLEKWFVDLLVHNWLSGIHQCGIWTFGVSCFDMHAVFFSLPSFKFFLKKAGISVNCLQVHGNNNRCKWYGSCKVEKLSVAQYSGLVWSVKLNTQTLLHSPLCFYERSIWCRLHGMKLHQVRGAPGFPSGRLNLSLLHSSSIPHHCSLQNVQDNQG